MDTRAFRTRNGRELKFSVIGLGTVPIGEVYELLDEKTAIATVEQAWASGVRLFDTSPHYGNGIAESRLGAGLRRAPRAEIIVSTKIGRVMNPFAKPAPRNPDVFSPGFVGGYAHAPRFDYSYDGTMRSVEQS
jgi:D-threo-aldose 1-dehydrogenase